MILKYNKLLQYFKLGYYLLNNRKIFIGVAKKAKTLHSLKYIGNVIKNIMFYNALVLFYSVVLINSNYSSIFVDNGLPNVF